MAKKDQIERQMHLKLTCLKPPQPHSEGDATLFGLQDRMLQLHPGQVQPDGSLLFEFDVSVAIFPENKKIQFRGPYVHGTATLPFLYLSWKRTGVEPVEWIKRLKIPLPALTWEQFEGLTTPTICYLGRVSGSSSGTVPLLEGVGFYSRTEVDHLIFR